MSNLKKYLIPVFVVGVVVALLILSNNPAKDKPIQKTKTASQKVEQNTGKVESSETSQSENYQLGSPETKTQNSSQKQTTQQNSQSNGSTNEAGAPVKEVSLKIEAGAKGTYTYQIPWESGDNVWTVLERAGQLEHFPIEYDDKTYKPRIYVTDIYDANCECWTFKVDGICSNVSANSYSVSENDSILWSINKMCS